jgi:hypothetical protein
MFSIRKYRMAKAPKISLIIFFISFYAFSADLDTTLCNNCNPCEDSIAGALRKQSLLALSDAQKNYIQIRDRQCEQLNKTAAIQSSTQNNKEEKKQEISSKKEKPYSSINVRNEYFERIRNGRTACIAGACVWGAGALLETVGYLNIVGDVKEYDSPSSASLSLFIPGLVLEAVVGPIASCVGESSVLKSVLASHNDTLFPSSELNSKGWRLYIIASSLTVAGIGLDLGGMATYYGWLGPPLLIAGVICSGAGEILRGAAAIAPLIHVSDIIARVSFVPTFDTKGKVGIALSIVL